MVPRWLALTALLALPGCQTAQSVDRAGIISELSVRVAALLFTQGSEPAPTPAPKDGCDVGCRCNGTGEEKSGDGLAVVSCRCEDSCKCKEEKKGLDEPVVEEPPLVPIPQPEPKPAPQPVVIRTVPQIMCEGGACFAPPQRQRGGLFRR